MAGIKIDFVADVAKFISGTKDVDGALEDVIDSLDDVEAAGKNVEDAAKAWGTYEDAADDAASSVQDMADDAKKSLDDISDDAKRAGDDVEDKLGDSFDTVADDAKTAANDTEGNLEGISDAAKTEGDTVERTFSDAFDEVKRTVKKSSDDAAKSVGDAFEDNALTADDVFKADLKAELVSNMAEAGAEVARGFKDGFGSEDAETLLDGVTDTMVSVGTLGGPLGAAAGLAGATAVQAFAGPFIQKAQATAEQFEETFSTAFDNIIAEGEEKGRELTIQANVDTLVQDQDKLNAATERANTLGVDRGVVLRAMAGDQDAFNIVQGAAAEKTDAVNERLAESRQRYLDGTLSLEDWNAAQDEANNQLEEINPRVDVVTDSYNTNTDAVDAASDAARAKGESDQFAAGKATELAQKTAASTGKAQEFDVTIDGVNKTLKAMPNGKIVEVTDDGTAKLTQKEINDITGKDVTTTVYLDDATAWARLNELTRNRSVDIAVNLKRNGQYAI